MEALRRGLDFSRRTRSSRRHPMSDRIAGTNGITSRQPTTFGAKNRKAIGAFGFEIAFLFRLRPSVIAMKQDILKVAALSLLTFAAFILTSLNQAQNSHAQNGTTTMAQSAPTEKTVEQVFKNIKVLNGMPQSQLYPTMRFMAASLGFQCGSCHVINNGF